MEISVSELVGITCITHKFWAHYPLNLKAKIHLISTCRIPFRKSCMIVFVRDSKLKKRGLFSIVTYSPSRRSRHFLIKAPLEVFFIGTFLHWSAAPVFVFSYYICDIPVVYLWNNQSTFANIISFIASGTGRCEINNGGCWKHTKHGSTFSACLVSESIDGENIKHKNVILFRA